MCAITPVIVQVVFKQGEEAQSFKLSRTRVAPRTVIHLSSGQLALCNISFLVADADLSHKHLLIGLTVLRYLRIDSRTLLENNRSTLDGTDCKNIGNSTRGGNISRLMAARTQQVKGKVYIHGTN